MSTRSTYRVIKKYEYEGKVYKRPLVLLYVHMDGYPNGHPLDTARWLSGGKVVAGINIFEKGLVFNGTSCLAAALVAFHKTGPGGAYIFEQASRNNAGEDYTYDIIVDEETQKIEYVAYEAGCGKKGNLTKEIFRGTPAEYVEKYSQTNNDDETD